MIVYIASSWKNQHAVAMLTAHLRALGIDVKSWIENSFGEDAATKSLDFDTWVNSEEGEKSFTYDASWAAGCDLLIYVGPAGCDAWAEVGIAYGNDRPILGLSAKGEQVGLMRRLVVRWFDDYRDLVAYMRELSRC